jgi:hypothetical protein
MSPITRNSVRPVDVPSQGEHLGWPGSTTTSHVCDYLLGGKDNYPADRAAAEKAIEMMPDGVVRTSAIQNRRFLIRAVRHLTLDYRIRQFPGRSLFWCGVARKR